MPPTVTRGAVALALGLLWAGLGGLAGPPAGAARAPRPLVRTASMPGAGTVLATSSHFALYVFAPDHHHRVSCRGDCAQAWPPLLVRPASRPRAGRGVHAKLLGTIASPTGGRQVTYKGWPLYTYTGDLAPNEASGQGLDRNGGYWYTIAPSGRLVRR